MYVMADKIIFLYSKHKFETFHHHYTTFDYKFYVIEKTGTDKHTKSKPTNI